MMTKENYRAIAQAVHESQSKSVLHPGYISPEVLIDKLCHVFEQNNPNFYRTRFMVACRDGVK